jgi:virulence-associated protein VapD
MRQGFEPQQGSLYFEQKKKQQQQQQSKAKQTDKKKPRSRVLWVGCYGSETKRPKTPS